MSWIEQKSSPEFPVWMKAALVAAAVYNLAWGAWVVLDPGALFRVAAIGHAYTVGGAKGHAIGLVAPLGSRIRPWKTLLARSGRPPH